VERIVFAGRNGRNGKDKRLEVLTFVEEAEVKGSKFSHGRISIPMNMLSFAVRGHENEIEPGSIKIFRPKSKTARFPGALLTESGLFSFSGTAAVRAHDRQPDRFL